MGKLAVESNVEWKKWGEVDPLYGVASCEGKARGSSAPWTDAEFYELGRSDWEEFRAHWEHYGLDRTACLEIGCGAGRITTHLSQYFQQTHAMDVSEGMLRYAREHVPNETITFHLSDGVRIPLADSAVTAVFSTHVFQHFDSLAHASAYFADISRVLGKGGSLMIHLPIHHWPAWAKTLQRLYSVRTALAGGRAWVRRRLMARGWSLPIMRRLSYPVGYLYDELPRCGLSDVEVRIISPKSNWPSWPAARHPFVFARKR